MTKEQIEFILSVTGRLGHWEDPEWGKRVLKAMSLLASDITDTGARAAILHGIDSAMVKAASTQDPIPPSRQQLSAK